MSPSPIPAKYGWFCLIAVIFTWLLHEFTHFSVGEILGYDMIMTLNSTFTARGVLIPEADYQVISIAGPLVTLVQALIVFGVMRNGSYPRFYPFLFTALYMRVMAAVMSAVTKPNDEARVSAWLGWGKMTLPLLTVLILFVLVFLTAKKYSFGAKFNLVTLGWILFFSSILIVSDMYWKVVLL